MKKFIKLIFVAGLIFFAATFVTMLFFINETVKNVPTGNETVLIVLGSRTVEGKPGKNMLARLDTAYEYYKSNDGLTFIVSGGQGDDQIVSEAFTMREYLIGLGVPSDRIIMENRSRNTRQNFEYSKIILDENFPGESVIFVTNRFHCLRAAVYAKQAGIESFTVYAAPDVINPAIFYSYLREYAALWRWLVLE